MPGWLPSFARQTVTVQRAPLVTDHGNQIRDWSAAAGHAISGCVVVPQPGSENNINRSGTVAPFLLIAPAGADLEASDRVVYSGRTFEVDGPVRRWDTGVLDHVEADLQEVSG